MNIRRWKCIICYDDDYGDQFEDTVYVSSLNSIIQLPEEIGYYGDTHFHIAQLILIPCYEK